MECKPCRYPCLTCTTETSCNSCISNLIEDRVLNGNTCLTECPSTKYNLSGTCMNCPA